MARILLVLASIAAVCLVLPVNGANLRETVQSIKKQLDELEREVEEEAKATGKSDPDMEKQIDGLQDCIKDHITKLDQEANLGLNTTDDSSNATRRDDASASDSAPASTGGNSASTGDDDDDDDDDDGDDSQAAKPVLSNENIGDEDLLAEEADDEVTSSPGTASEG